MARRLTGFSKLIITLLILALIFFGGRYVLNNTGLGERLEGIAETERTEQAESKNNPSTNSTTSKNSNNSRRDDDVLRVQLVTWGGYGPGLYFNEGHQASTKSRFYRDYGFKVEFVLENDLLNAMNSWMTDEYDVIVQTADAFPLYTAPADINQFKPKAFMQVDWSRGGDAIIAKRGINTINDLKGKRIALAVPAPSQTFLISSLEAAGMQYSDVTVVKTSDPLKAAELFRGGDIDAAVVWSPDDLLATADVPGSKILLTTLESSHLIGDIMLAKEDVINRKQKMFDGFYEGWMKAVAELKNKTNRAKAGKYLAEFNQLGVEDGMGMMETVYWTTHGDNQNFFGLNGSYKGQKMADLYNKMSKKFVETNDLDVLAPNIRSVINTSSIQNANLSGAMHAAEASKNFKPSSLKDKTATAFATKPVSINFSSGEYTLSENAKTIIDLQFAEVAKSFGNVKVRIEGNTDNVGARAMNMDLSHKRAQAVAEYLRTQYGLNANKFVIVGNGPDRPVAGCENNGTQDCKAKNRRTEFKLIPA